MRHGDLDTLEVDALLLPMFSGREQPRGAAGCLDWRLCGGLARMIRCGDFSGGENEVSLLSYRARIRPARVFLVGLGHRGPRSALRCHRDVERMVDVLMDAQVESVALGPPRPGVDGLLPGWLSAPAWSRTLFGRLVLLDTDGHVESCRDALGRSVDVSTIDLEPRGVGSPLVGPEGEA